MLLASQVKISLSPVMKQFVVGEAKKYGLTMADFFRHLVTERMERITKYPEYEASESTVRAYRRALKEQSEGKLVEIGSVEKFLKEL